MKSRKGRITISARTWVIGLAVLVLVLAFSMVLLTSDREGGLRDHFFSPSALKPDDE